MDSQTEEKIPSVAEVQRRIGENAVERRYLRQLLKLAESREQMQQTDGGADA